jgi:hypothetical protein
MAPSSLDQILDANSAYLYEAYEFVHNYGSFDSPLKGFTGTHTAKSTTLTVV